MKVTASLKLVRRVLGLTLPEPWATTLLVPRVLEKR